MMSKGTNFRIVLLLFFSLVVFRAIFSYTSTYEYSVQKRTEIAMQYNEDIHVAAVWKKNDSSFMMGVNLAVGDINKQGIMLKSGDKEVKSRIVLHEFDDSTEQSSLQSRLSIAGDHKIVAVIGHSSSDSAIPASVTYEYNGILFISPVATEPKLTNHGFKYTFSIVPSADSVVSKLMGFAKERGWQKLLFLYSRDHYGMYMSESFLSQLKPPLIAVQAKSFPVVFTDNSALIHDLMEKDFDAIVLVAVKDSGVRMIRQLRDMGVTKPILAGLPLDTTQIWNLSGKTTNQTYVASIFSGQIDFEQKFKQVYGIDSGYTAYQGYESVNILADAIQKTGSSDPIRVATTLKYNYKQGYGGYVFETNGLSRNKKIYIKQMVDGKFVLID